MLAILKDSVFFINIVFALIVLFLERKRPMYTLFWITLLLLTSYLGFLAYLFLDLNFTREERLKSFIQELFSKNFIKVIITR